MTKLHSLNRNELKYLVIIAMLIDHIAWAFVPTASLLGQIMHIIGRLTGPTMAYMLADGYYYTRSVEKYACRLGIFALLSWIPFSYFELGHIGLQFGVIYTLLLSLLAIWLWDKGTDEEEAAALMGAKGWTIFTKVTFPHIKWAFLYGVVLCTARAMGEFGAVSVLSGHLRGKTNTLPLHVEILYNEFQYVPAFAVSSILVILAVILLIARNVLEHKGKGEKGDVR